MRKCLDDLGFLIDRIQAQYNQVTELWERYGLESINLRKKTIAEVEVSGKIYRNIV